MTLDQLKAYREQLLSKDTTISDELIRKAQSSEFLKEKSDAYNEMVSKLRLQSTIDESIKETNASIDKIMALEHMQIDEKLDQTLPEDGDKGKVSDQHSQQPEQIEEYVKQADTTKRKISEANTTTERMLKK